MNIKRDFYVTFLSFVRMELAFDQGGAPGVFGYHIDLVIHTMALVDLVYPCFMPGMVQHGTDESFKGESGRSQFVDRLFQFVPGCAGFPVFS